jgi:hypothetical protein
VRALALRFDVDGIADLLDALLVGSKNCGGLVLATDLKVSDAFVLRIRMARPAEERAGMHHHP